MPILGIIHNVFLGYIGEAMENQENKERKNHHRDRMKIGLALGILAFVAFVVFRG